ncbi:MAG: 4-hydroxy-tetrahydrodipicolinate reductase [Desulfovibrio sp.]|nr:4-hydroxy-tetrahydrodipicolinate reductase [Desulfovibrio sp.]
MSKNTTSVIIIGANGRMGKTLREAIAENPAFGLAGAVDLSPAEPALTAICPTGASLEDVINEGARGVIIDFSSPDSSMGAAEAAARNGLPIVIGSTGFTRKDEATLETLALKTPMLRSANMSVGVNVLLEFLPLIAKALGPAYDMEILETHHRRKKDAPSGTALILAEALASAREWKLDDVRVSGRDGVIGERPDKQIGVMALRGGDVPGVHDCFFFGPGEIIEIRHTSETRQNFARGALRAAAWLKDKKPGKLYSMLDVIALDKTDENENNGDSDN